MPYDSIEFPEAELTINGEKVTFTLRRLAIDTGHISMPIRSKTHDYLCPDCLAIVHDETEVPECTGWPKAMQHARRFMEPFGGEI